MIHGIEGAVAFDRLVTLNDHMKQFAERAEQLHRKYPNDLTAQLKYEAMLFSNQLQEQVMRSLTGNLSKASVKDIFNAFDE